MGLPPLAPLSADSQPRLSDMLCSWCCGQAAPGLGGRRVLADGYWQMGIGREYCVQLKLVTFWV